MPLHDHFHAPLGDRRRWEGFHSLWPSFIVQNLSRCLPAQYYAEPCVFLGTDVEPAQDTFEVLVYDERRHQRLVAAVEVVSPANKDRPEHRRGFATKCASRLQEKVALAVVDIVTERHADLHAQLLQALGIGTSGVESEGMHLNAAAYRTTKENGTWRLDVWPQPLALGAPLPTLPLWLAADLAVPLNLEATYEETCRALHII